jgi:hypothetical protein
VGQIELIAGTRRSEDGIAHGQKERVDHDLGSKGGRFTRQTGDVPGLGMKDLYPRVEMTHVGVGQRDVRLNFVIDRRYDVARQQIVDHDSTVRQKRLYDSLGPYIGLNPLQLTVVNWCHVLPLLDDTQVFHAGTILRETIGAR